MITLVATFGAPQEVGSSGFDGKAFRFPFAAIDAQHIGTPRQSSNLMQGRITVEASGSLLAVWRVSGPGVIKALFQVAKEHITSLLQSSGRVAGDIKLSIGSYTHPGPCPFDIELIEEPEGAVVQLEVSRPIGFL